jgi:hypothetical protein
MRATFRVFQVVVTLGCLGGIIIGQSVKGKTTVADPIIGTWKLNVAKSSFSPVVQAAFKVAQLKERTEIYRELDGGRMEWESPLVGFKCQSALDGC